MRGGTAAGEPKVYLPRGRFVEERKGERGRRGGLLIWF